MVLPSAGLLSGCPPLLASDGSLPGKAASGRGEDPREAVPAQLHGQTQRPSLHVGRQRFYQTSPSTWYSSYSMGRDSRGKGSVRFKVRSPSPGPPDAPTPVFRTLLTPRALDQGPGGLPAAWTLIPTQPPGLRSGYPSKDFPHLPHQVKCYLSLEAHLKSFLHLLFSSNSLPVSLGILHFPARGSVCVEFLQLPAPGRGSVSSLLILLLQGFWGSLHPPGHSLAKIRGVGPVTGA